MADKVGYVFHLAYPDREQGRWLSGSWIPSLLRLCATIHDTFGCPRLDYDKPSFLPAALCSFGIVAWDEMKGKLDRESPVVSQGPSTRSVRSIYLNARTLGTPVLSFHAMLCLAMPCHALFYGYFPYYRRGVSVLCLEFSPPRGQKEVCNSHPLFPACHQRASFAVWSSGDASFSPHRQTPFNHFQHASILPI